MREHSRFWLSIKDLAKLLVDWLVDHRLDQIFDHVAKISWFVERECPSLRFCRRGTTNITSKHLMFQDNDVIWKRLLKVFSSESCWNEISFFHNPAIP